jgi:hypothetical protein
MDPGPWCVASQADLGQQWALSPSVSINFQVSLTVIRYLSLFCLSVLSVILIVRSDYFSLTYRWVPVSVKNGC